MIQSRILAAAVAISMAFADDAADKPSAGYPAVMLLGGTAFIMVLFYMVNSHFTLVSSHTWSMLSAAMSIFTAVMVNNWLNDVVNKTVGLDPAGSGGGLIVSAALQLAFYWLAVILLLCVFKASVLRLKGYGTIGGHIMGFASIGLWAQVVKADPFNTSAWWIVPVVLIIYLVSMSTFFAVFGFLAKKMKSAGMSAEDKARWHDQSVDTGTDFFCLGTAWIITTWVKFLIYDKLDPAFADPVTPHAAADMWKLGMSGVLFFFFGASFTILGHKYQGSTLIDLSTTVSYVIASMCVVDVFTWKDLPTAGSAVMGHLTIAVQLSMISAALIVVVAILGMRCGTLSRALRGVFTGLALAVGASWEKTFDASVDSLDAFGINDAQKALVTIFVAAIVFPAWMVYVLPKADDELKETITKSPPVWAICCDNDPCEEENEYDEGEWDDEDA